MALPVSPPPKSDDVARRAWASITIQVAWTLLAHGVKVRPEVLNAARTNALLQIPPTTPDAQAVDLAAAATERFVYRAKGKRFDNAWPHDANMPLSPRWHRAMLQALNPHTATVFRDHYGDNRSLAWIAQHRSLDRMTVESARAGLREMVRQTACDDGLPLRKWPTPRLDRLLVRMAGYAPGPCPPVFDVAEGAHRDHVRTCPRCDRLHRLVRAGVLSTKDLQAPSLGARPTKDAEVLALHFHPDGRQHRGKLLTELPGQAHAVGDDLLLVDATDPATLNRILVLAAEVCAPRAEHLRGARLSGPGVWTRYGLLGPLADEVQAAVEAKSWGIVDGLGDLPAPLPEPPSATASWLAVAALAAATVLVAVWAGPTPMELARHPLDVDFSPGRGGVWTAFDVDDEAAVGVIHAVDDQLYVVLDGQHPADRAEYATGDGSFRIHVAGQGVLVVSSAQALTELEAHVAEVTGRNNALQELARRLRTDDPRADIEVFDG